MIYLSVIVPIYNSEKYLKRCVDSIVNQELKEIEIILVNDGSTDSSGSICDEYAKIDDRIKVIHKENEGKLMARYSGVKEAQCEYITFVDSDDWIEANCYNLFVKQMNAHIDMIAYGKKVDTEKSGITLPKFTYSEGLYNSNCIRDVIYKNMLWDNQNYQSGISHSLCDKIFTSRLLKKSYNIINEKKYVNMGEDAMILFPIFQWINSLYISHESPLHYTHQINKIPVYMSDAGYFRNLYKWREYLIANTKGIAGVEKQIDYMYMYMVNLKKECYGDYTHNDEYIFPFQKELCGKKIIIYGAGRVGCTYINQIRRSEYCDVVAWVDKNYEKYSGREIKNPKEIMELQFDYIVVAIESRDIQKDVIEWFQKIGIKKDKIIN